MLLLWLAAPAALATTLLLCLLLKPLLLLLWWWASLLWLRLALGAALLQALALPSVHWCTLLLWLLLHLLLRAPLALGLAHTALLHTGQVVAWPLHHLALTTTHTLHALLPHHWLHRCTPHLLLWWCLALLGLLHLHHRGTACLCLRQPLCTYTV